MSLRGRAVVFLALAQCHCIEYAPLSPALHAPCCPQNADKRTWSEQHVICIMGAILLAPFLSCAYAFAIGAMGLVDAIRTSLTVWAFTMLALGRMDWYWVRIWGEVVYDVQQRAAGWRLE